MNPLTFYNKPGPMTEAGKHASLFDNLPDDLASLCKIVQNNMIHVFWAERMNIKLSKARRSTLQIRPISEKFEQIAKTNNKDLTTPRSLDQRQVGNCRDFTLLLVSMLRHKGIPARARCGFGTYFEPGRYIDHWVGEYWNASEKRWIMVDSELDPSALQTYNIRFDPLDVPSDEFIVAGKAWKMCRTEGADPDRFGILDMHGLRFVWGDVVRDFLALNKIEILPWDGGWGFLNCKLSDPLPSEDTLKLYDKIAQLTVEINERFAEVRAYYKEEPMFRVPSGWGVRSDSFIEPSICELSQKGDPSMSAPAQKLKPSAKEALIHYQMPREKRETASTQASDSEFMACGFSGSLGDILVKGASEHNLKHVTVAIPRYKLVVLTGVSGSGKSSLAFDTIYAEGQRRFVESLSPFLRRQLEQMEKPNVEAILGLSPTIAIEQKGISRNPRSSVGTVTEVFNYLRVLYSRIGIQHCNVCGQAVEPMGPQEITDELAALRPGTELTVAANAKSATDEPRAVFRVPESESENAEFKARLFDAVEKALELGNGAVAVSIKDEKLLFTKNKTCPECGTIQPELRASMFSSNTPYGMCPECTGLGFKLAVDPKLIVTRPELSLLDGASPWFRNMRGKDKSFFTVNNVFSIAEHYGADLELSWNQLPEEFRHALLHGSGQERIKFTAAAEWDEGKWKGESLRVYEGLVYHTNRLFRETDSEGRRKFYMQFMSRQTCPVCMGERLCKEARTVTVAGKTFPEVAKMSVQQAHDWISSLSDLLPPSKLAIVKELLSDTKLRLRFMLDVGLHYLTLERPAPTLSGGEGQRIQLSNQLGSGLVGVLYVLDEPSVGLHPVDHGRLLNTLKMLRDAGNTVLVVEHDEQTMRNADWLIDLGPGAGLAGGEIVAAGTPKEVAHNRSSLTGKYLSGELAVTTPNAGSRRKAKGWLLLKGARLHNLKSINSKIPLGVITCVTGVSGSGKSSLIAKTLFPILAKALQNAQANAGPYDSIEGQEHIDKVINITQAPIGRTPRSNPVTYVKVFDEMRRVFASVPEARTRNYKPGQFSFNVKGGRCEECKGHGQKMVEMHFLPDVWIPCQECKGTRYNRRTLEIKYRGLNISEILDLDVKEALSFFKEHSKITWILKTLDDVGLGYVKLGQSATTLSGGEAQRVKLAKELSDPATGRTVYFLDEPTTGLHFADIQQLLNVLHRLVDAGNTVVTVEHNLEVIKNADWIIDLGPGGGDAGGYIVAEGTPEEVARAERSFTGRYLKNSLHIE